MSRDSAAVSIDAAAGRAREWLAGFAAESGSDDTEGACLVLFGLSCADRLAEADGDPGGRGITERLARRLARCWEANPSLARAEFTAGRFITPLLMAAASAPWGEAGRSLRTACEREWRALPRESLARENPILFWTGVRLCSVIRGERPEPIRVPWQMTIDVAAPPYAIAPSDVRQMTAELALLSAYGALDPQLTNTVAERLRTVLPCLMFIYIKDRDLETVCLLLRALNYANLRTVPEFADGVEFVVQQNSRDGYFAMHSIALRLHVARSHPSVQRSVLLPLSVSALWALGESLEPTRGLLVSASRMLHGQDHAAH